MSTILQMLDREGLISDEQFKQLGELENHRSNQGYKNWARIEFPSTDYK